MSFKNETIVEMKQLCGRNGLTVSDLMDITALLIISVMCGSKYKNKAEDVIPGLSGHFNNALNDAVVAWELSDLSLKGKNDETV